MTIDEHLPDAHLAMRAAKGDDRAFAMLVRRYKEGIYRLLRPYLGSSDEAYEATHEAFIAAWIAIDRYDASRPFSAWLRTIAINKARDRARRSAFRRWLFGSKAFEESGALEAPDSMPTAEAELAAQQELAAIEDAITRLPLRLKEPLLLTLLEGLSQQEVAAMLGVSVKTVETRTYRARKLLGEILEARSRR